MDYWRTTSRVEKWYKNHYFFNDSTIFICFFCLFLIRSIGFRNIGLTGEYVQSGLEFIFFENIFNINFNLNDDDFFPFRLIWRSSQSFSYLSFFFIETGVSRNFYDGIILLMFNRWSFCLFVCTRVEQIVETKDDLILSLNFFQNCFHWSWYAQKIIKTSDDDDWK